ncbi:MAG: aromatic ring-hydroxylating dioxygenase subunit alpha [bacterium]|nr:aromatic ring-hydroxylating dioxygenase subunit alpha [bacterium]
MRDVCGSLREHWYVACTARELTVGVPLQRTIMEVGLALFRDAEGHPAAVIDRCAHRNARLGEGEVRDGCLACPYHGWTYDREGRCVEIPSEGGERRLREGKRVESFPTREAHGLVWVWMGNPARVVEEPFPMPYYRTDGWDAYYMITPFRGNVTNLVENFMDVPHTVFVHSRWFRNRKRVHGEAIVRRTVNSVEVEYLHRDGIGFADWALNPDGLPMTHTDRFFMPNVTRVDYRYGTDRHFVIASQITPISEHESLVYTAIAYRFGWFTKLLRPFLAWYTRRVIEQDVAIMRNQTHNIEKDGPRFSSTEADVIHACIESLRHQAERGEDTPLPPLEKKIAFWI